MPGPSPSNDGGKRRMESRRERSPTSHETDGKGQGTRQDLGPSGSPGAGTIAGRSGLHIQSDCNGACEWGRRQPAGEHRISPLHGSARPRPRADRALGHEVVGRVVLFLRLVAVLRDRRQGSRPQHERGGHGFDRRQDRPKGPNRGGPTAAERLAADTAPRLCPVPLLRRADSRSLALMLAATVSGGVPAGNHFTEASAKPTPASTHVQPDTGRARPTASWRPQCLPVKQRQVATAMLPRAARCVRPRDRSAAEVLDRVPDLQLS